MDSAAGIIEAKEEISLQSPAFKALLTRTLLEGTPAAYCVGRLCAQTGVDFHWKPYNLFPEVLDADGEPVPIVVKDYVPYVHVSDDLKTSMPSTLTTKPVSKLLDDLDDHSDYFDAYSYHILDDWEYNLSLIIILRCRRSYACTLRRSIL